MATIELPAGMENAEFVNYGELQKTYENKLSSLVGQRIGVYGVPDNNKLQIVFNKEAKVIDAPAGLCKRVAGNLRLLNSQHPGRTAIIVVDVKKDGQTVYLDDPDNPKGRVKRPRKAKAKTATTSATTAKK